MNRLYFEGLDLEEWARFPETVLQEAESIVTEHVVGAQADIAAAYPPEASALAAPLEHTVDVETDNLRIIANVRNPHPLAWIYDHGTMVRHTEAGINRGAEGPRHVFIPRAYEWARRQYLALSKMLEERGFRVSGVMDDGDVIG
jgi:hypothetical protein